MFNSPYGQNEGVYFTRGECSSFFDGEEQPATSSNSSAFPSVVDSISHSLWGNPSVFANTGAYVESAPLLGFGFQAEQQEERGVFSVIRDLFLGSPEREYDVGNTSGAWGENSCANYPVFESGRNGNGGYHAFLDAPEGKQSPCVLVDSPSDSDSLSDSDEAQSIQMFHDWMSIENNCFKYSESDVDIDRAIENLSVLYLNSPDFRDMISTLANHLKAIGRRIHIHSGTEVSYGKFRRENLTLTLNTTAVPEEGKQLAMLALHLTHAAYLTHPSNEGTPSSVFKKQSSERLETYHQQAGVVLEKMGWGEQSIWVKSKPTPLAPTKVEPAVSEPVKEASVLVKTCPAHASSSLLHKFTPKKGFKTLLRSARIFKDLRF